MSAEDPMGVAATQLFSKLFFTVTFLASVFVLVSISPALTNAQSDTSPDCMGNYCKTMPYKGSPYLTGNCQPPKQGQSPSKDGLVGKPCAVKGQKITVTGKCLPTQPKCKSVGDTGEKMMPMMMPMLPMLPMPMPKMMMPMMMPMPSNDPCSPGRDGAQNTGSSSPTSSCPKDSLWGNLFHSTFGGAGDTLGEIANSAKRLIIGPIQEVVGLGKTEEKKTPPLKIVVDSNAAALDPNKAGNISSPSATSPDLTYTSFKTGSTGFGGSDKTVTPPEPTTVLGTMLEGLRNALSGLLGLLK